MSDKKPIYAGTRADRFAYAKEFASTDGVDTNQISYDAIGNNYLIHDNISDNLDAIENTFSQWESAKTLTTFEVWWDDVSNFNMSPCDVDIQMQFDTVIRDTDSGWNYPSFKYVVQKAGYYWVESAMKWDIGATNNYNSNHMYFTNKIYVNDVLHVEGYKGCSHEYRQNTNDQSRPIRDVSDLIYLNVGDTVSIWAERREIPRLSSAVGEQNLCTDNPIVRLTNAVYSYTNDAMVNYFTINMVYSG